MVCPTIPCPQSTARSSRSRQSIMLLATMTCPYSVHIMRMDIRRRRSSPIVLGGPNDRQGSRCTLKWRKCSAKTPESRLRAGWPAGSSGQPTRNNASAASWRSLPLFVELKPEEHGAGNPCYILIERSGMQDDRLCPLRTCAPWALRMVARNTYVPGSNRSASDHDPMSGSQVLPGLGRDRSAGPLQRGGDLVAALGDRHHARCLERQRTVCGEATANDEGRPIQSASALACAGRGPRPRRRPIASRAESCSRR